VAPGRRELQMPIEEGRHDPFKAVALHRRDMDSMSHDLSVSVGDETPRLTRGKEGGGMPAAGKNKKREREPKSPRGDCDYGRLKQPGGLSRK